LFGPNLDPNNLISLNCLLHEKIKVKFSFETISFGDLKQEFKNFLTKEKASLADFPIHKVAL